MELNRIPVRAPVARLPLARPELARGRLIKAYSVGVAYMAFGLSMQRNTR